MLRGMSNTAAPAASAPEVFFDEPVPAPDAGGARRPPTPPTGSGRKLEEVILPSGRAVRLSLVKTAQYLEAKERAAATAGDPARQPDPRGARYTRALDHEMCALSVVAYTEALEWDDALASDAEAQRAAYTAKYGEPPHPSAPPYIYQPDAAAMLATVPESAWLPTTPLELLTPGERSLDSVFCDVADWEVLTASVGRLLLPKRNLSGVVGKGRPVVR